MSRHYFAGFGAALTLFVFPLIDTARAQCDGDCNGDRQVTVDELVAGVGLALGTGGTSCAAIDSDGNGTVVISELIVAVNHLLAGCPPPANYPLDDTLRLNQIQVLGTHNSYHLEADPQILEILAGLSAGLVKEIEYEHPPLPEQFETQGIRQIEIDTYADPQGGLYASPFGLRLVTGDPNARIPELEAPGFKVLHIQDIDFRTNCATLIECLTEVKTWSDAHPGHVPIMIQIEAEDTPYDVGLDFAVPIPFDPPIFDALDAEIRSVFPADQIITPDVVRGAHETLREAIEQDGWPTLGQSRGKVLLCLDNEGSYRDNYLAGHAGLRGRVLFTSSEPPADEAGFIKLNDPLGDFDHIKDVVAQGFIVRTRADADTLEARSGNVAPRDAAIASGAQFVSTDYPVPNPEFGTGYMVAIPGGTPARCNPISAPAACASTDIENPAHLADR